MHGAMYKLGYIAFVACIAVFDVVYFECVFTGQLLSKTKRIIIADTHNQGMKSR